MGIFCVKCGKHFTAMKQKRRIVAKRCPQAQRPEADWPTQPGFRRSETSLADSDIVERHNKGRHKILWNGKTGKKHYQEDEGLIRCSQCELAWSFKELRSNFPRTKCSGNAQAARRERRNSREGIQKWKAAHPESHEPDWDDQFLRWRCSKCGIGGGRGYGSRFEAALVEACAPHGGGLRASTVELKKKRGVG
jgi:hypothetical protein